MKRIEIEYIDRDSAVLAVCKVQQNPYYQLINGPLNALFAVDVKTRIKAIPSVVVPVRHGRWLKSEIPGEKFVCSECGGACWYYDYGGEVARSRYCPNCGAKMEA